MQQPNKRMQLAGAALVKERHIVRTLSRRRS